MNKAMGITPEVLEKIDRAHAVSSGIMNKFKAEEPTAAALAKINPVSQESTSSSAKTSSSKKSAVKVK